MPTPSSSGSHLASQLPPACCCCCSPCGCSSPPAAAAAAFFFFLRAAALAASASLRACSALYACLQRGRGETPLCVECAPDCAQPGVAGRPTALTTWHPAPPAPAAAAQCRCVAAPRRRMGGICGDAGGRGWWAGWDGEDSSRGSEPARQPAVPRLTPPPPAAPPALRQTVPRAAEARPPPQLSTQAHCRCIPTHFAPAGRPARMVACWSRE